jgi:rubrerythrin
MEFTGESMHQGDVQIFGVKAIPEGAKRIEKRFIAASEQSGSFHALFGNYDMYEVDGGVVIDAKEDCILNHSLEQELAKINNNLDDAKVIPKKDHRHTVFTKGVYFVSIQNRFDPLEGFRKKVKD